MRRSKLGEKNPMWKEHGIGYVALHRWVGRRLSKPKLCQTCNNKLSYDLANITGIYSRALDNWKWLCRRCHMLSDGRMNNLWRKGHKFTDMSNRLCAICESNKTSINKKGRPIWRYSDNQIICHLCKCKEYDKTRGHYW